jgi:hypothetical protein
MGLTAVTAVLPDPDPTLRNGQDIGTISKTKKFPMVQNWNIGVQKERRGRLGSKSN